MRFGRFELQPRERRLLDDGAPVALGARAFDLLLVLAERAGHLVTRNELIERVWTGLVVEENNLSVQINALRKALGGDIIVTIPGRGYRFTATLAAAPAAGAATPPAVAPLLRTNLPVTLAPLIGRHDDLTELATLLDEHRLLTIVGAGGIGKTLLAQHLLAGREKRHAHGVCWVELAPVTDAATIAGAISAALGVQRAAGEPLDALAQTLAPLDLLLALDNAEHLLAGVAAVADVLHRAAPKLRLLVTSQAPLKLAAERVLRIGPLAVPPNSALPAAEALAFGAIGLFAERAQAADGRFALSDANAPAVIELCRALDGMALAIELAAARAPTLGVQRLSQSMHERLRLLTTSRNRAAPARQQTLRAALEWSHALLDERERAVFRRLAAFAGSASLALVQQVAADESLDEWALLDALQALVERSLVVVGSDEHGEPRYRLLDSPRAFALEQLAASGELPALRERHAGALRRHLEQCYEAQWSGRVGVDAGLLALEPDLDNAREAFQWARANDAECAVAISASLLGALPSSQREERCAMWDATEPLLASAGLAPALRARAWLEAADAYSGMRAKRARRYAEQALAQARTLGAEDDDGFMRYRALARLARLAAPDDEPAARAALAEMRSCEVASWPARRLLCGAGSEQACTSWFRDPATSLVHARRMMALEREAGSSTLNGLNCVVDIELELRHGAEALRNGLELVARLEGTRYLAQRTQAQCNLLSAWLANDAAAEARAVAGAHWPQAARYNMHAFYADNLALLAALERRPHASARLLGYADAAYAAMQSTRQVAESITVQRAEGSARQALGDAQFARLKAEGAALSDEDIAALAFGFDDT